jgi:hypothetical protein
MAEAAFLAEEKYIGSFGAEYSAGAPAWILRSSGVVINLHVDIGTISREIQFSLVDLFAKLL